MGKTFDSTRDIVHVQPGRSVSSEGPWMGSFRPRGTFIVEPVPEGTRVTLQAQSELRGLVKLMAFIVAPTMRRLLHGHLDGLRKALEP